MYNMHKCQKKLYTNTSFVRGLINKKTDHQRHKILNIRIIKTIMSCIILTFNYQSKIWCLWQSTVCLDVSQIIKMLVNLNPQISSLMNKGNVRNVNVNHHCLTKANVKSIIDEKFEAPVENYHIKITKIYFQPQAIKRLSWALNKFLKEGNESQLRIVTRAS